MQEQNFWKKIKKQSQNNPLKIFHTPFVVTSETSVSIHIYKEENHMKKILLSSLIGANLLAMGPAQPRMGQALKTPHEIVPEDDNECCEKWVTRGINGAAAGLGLFLSYKLFKDPTDYMGRNWSTVENTITITVGCIAGIGVAVKSCLNSENVDRIRKRSEEHIAYLLATKQENQKTKKTQ